MAQPVVVALVCSTLVFNHFDLDGRQVSLLLMLRMRQRGRDT